MGCLYRLLLLFTATWHASFALEVHHVDHGHFGDEPHMDDPGFEHVPKKEIHELKVYDENGHNELHRAAAAGAKRAVRKILNKGMDIDCRHGDGMPGGGLTALAIAADRGHDEVVSFLLYRGANYELDNPLILAAAKGHTETCAHLITKGAKIDAPGATYPSALWAASVMGQTKAMELLLQKGANPELKDVNGTSMLDAANAAARAHHDGKTLENLIAMGGGDYKWSLYHLRAAIKGHSRHLPKNKGKLHNVVKEASKEDL
jgi:hypothetical protein